MSRIRISAVVLALVPSSSVPSLHRREASRQVSDENRAILPDADHATSASTFGYVDKGLDPDDRPIDRTSCCQQDPEHPLVNAQGVGGQGG
jgi:hypothetical protein